MLNILRYSKSAWSSGRVYTQTCMKNFFTDKYSVFNTNFVDYSWGIVTGVLYCMAVDTYNSSKRSRI